MASKIRKHKEKFQIKEIKFSVFSMMGEGPKKTECQDSYLIMDATKEYYYAYSVLDGHGNSGKEASNSASDNLQKYFEKSKQLLMNMNTFKEREGFL